MNVTDLQIRRAMVRAQGGKIRRRKVPRGRQSAKARLRYYSYLRRILSTIEDQVRAIDLDGLVAQAVGEGIRTDALADDIVRVFRGFSVFLATAHPEEQIRSEVSQVAEAVNENQARDFRSQVKAALGLALIAPMPRGVINNFIASNIELVKSQQGAALERLRNTIMREVPAGTRVEEIRKMLQTDLKVSKSKAALLARDQTLKLYGKVAEERQVAAGLEEYDWDTSQDECVRPGHRVLHGTRQRWDDPPVVDPRTGRQAHPGGDYQCRCVAIPVFPELE